MQGIGRRAENRETLPGFPCIIPGAAKGAAMGKRGAETPTDGSKRIREHDIYKELSYWESIARGVLYQYGYRPFIDGVPASPFLWYEEHYRPENKKPKPVVDYALALLLLSAECRRNARRRKLEDAMLNMHKLTMFIDEIKDKLEKEKGGRHPKFTNMGIMEAIMELYGNQYKCVFRRNPPPDSD